MERRKFLSLAGLGAFSAATGLGQEAKAKKPYKIAITDWHIQSKGDSKAFAVAKECGLDGIQLSYVPGSKNHDLTDAAVRKVFLEESLKHQVEVAAMAMGVFNGQPFATTPDAEKWVQQCLEIMEEMQQKIVLLAFFGKGDMKDKPDMQKLVIERLKRLAPVAEKKGMVLGLETWLNKDDHMRIIDAVGSPAVKVYYDTANMTEQGYDINEEIRWLGKKNAICQIHLKENGERLGQGKVDFPAVKKALEDIEYKDWLVIESAIKNGWKESATANGKYLNTLFNGL